MKKNFLNIFLLISILLFSKSLPAQPPVYIWAKTILGNVESIQRGTMVDANGNVYITGVFFGTVDFDPGAGTAILTPVPYGCNAYIAKYDANGNYLWVRNIPINATYGNNSISIDANANIYITGFYSGTNVDFDGSAGTFFLSSVSAGNDIYFAKYDTNGNFIWAKSIGSTGDDRGNEILNDASGNVYVTGNFSITVDFDPGGGIASLISAGAADIFFAKYDCFGNFIWVKQIGGTGSDDVRDIAINNTGNIFLTGNFSATADFDPGAGVSNLMASGTSDAFIAKFDNNGNYLWAKNFGNTGNDGGSALKVDASGNILIAGIFAATVDFDPGAGVTNLSTASSALYYGRYDTGGNLLWIKQLPLNFYSMDITTDVYGNIFIAGNYGNGYASPIDMDPGPGVANLSVPTNLPPPTYNVLGKYDASGNYLWAGVFGRQCYCSVMGYKSSIATDASFLYYAGIFNGPFGTGTVDFDPGPGVANLIAPLSVDNVFFAKYGIASGPLPVELISFKGENKNNINHLYWSTATEINNDYFDVERGSDGVAFEIIGTVYGSGNSNQLINYSFNDKVFPAGINYYHLKQVDYNGEFKYSKVIAVKTNDLINTCFISSVKNNIFTFKCSEISNGFSELLNVDGKILKHTKIADSNEIKIDLSDFSQGIYFCKIISNEKFHNFKIIKN